MSVGCRILKKGYCEITQYYGNNGHLGIDIVGQDYTLDTVVSHSSGNVIYVQNGYTNNQGSSGNDSYGNMIKIDHGNGWVSLYAHLDKIYVSNGQQVKSGQEIGYMGNTGNSYGAHVHFEVWKDNKRINPLEYLNDDFYLAITLPVLRNENLDQLKVNVDDLHVRREPGINKLIIGFAELNGIYNYYEIKEVDGYKWFRIADNQWLANSNNWCTIYPKKEEEDEKMILELNNIIKKKNLLIEELETKMEEYNKKISELEIQIDKIKSQDGYNMFLAPKEDNYFIKLKENETLIYKKD